MNTGAIMGNNMRISVVCRLRNGRQQLAPNTLGAKIEFVDRSCGEFKPGTAVIVLGKTHDTRPESETTGALFVRVRKLRDDEAATLHTITKHEALRVEHNALVCRETKEIRYHEEDKICGAIASQKEVVFRRPDLRIDCIAVLPDDSAIIRVGPHGGYNIDIPQKLSRDFIEVVLGLSFEAEKERTGMEIAAEKCRCVTASISRAAEYARIVDLFFAAYPAANCEKNIDAVKEFAIRVKIAKRAGRVVVDHYASSMLEFNIEKTVYEIDLGSERFRFQGKGTLEEM